MTPAVLLIIGATFVLPIQTERWCPPEDFLSRLYDNGGGKLYRLPGFSFGTEYCGCGPVLIPPGYEILVRDVKLLSPTYPRKEGYRVDFWLSKKAEKNPPAWLMVGTEPCKKENTEGVPVS